VPSRPLFTPGKAQLNGEVSGQKQPMGSQRSLEDGMHEKNVQDEARNHSWSPRQEMHAKESRRSVSGER